MPSIETRETQASQSISRPQAGGPIDRIRDILAMPERAGELIEELGRLNDNLEGLGPTLERVPEFLEMFGRLIEVLEDYRTMTAPWLGFNVIEKDEKAK